LALTYGCGLRRSEAVAVDVADLDLVSGELWVRRGKVHLSTAAPRRPSRPLR
jgi:integrase